MSEQTLTVTKPLVYPLNTSMDTFASNYDGGFQGAALEALQLQTQIEGAENGTLTNIYIGHCADPKNSLETKLRFLREGAYAEQQRALHPDQAYHVFINVSTDLKGSEVKTLTDGAFAPIAALYHYVDGKGEPLHKQISTLDFNFNAQNFAPAKEVLARNTPGTFPVDKWFGYDFRDSSYWTWTYLGRIQVHAKGSVTLDESGNWSFDGELSSSHDIYDANSDPSRGALGENLTKALGMMNGTDYTIYLDGKIPLNLKGKK